MAEWYPEELDEVDDALDSSWLAGLSEYSATGGGSQPLHSPRLRCAVDRDDDPVGDSDSVEDFYRYSLARLTEDDRSSFDAEEQWEEGPLHIER